MDYIAYISSYQPQREVTTKVTPTQRDDKKTLKRKDLALSSNLATPTILTNKDVLGRLFLCRKTLPYFVNERNEAR